MSNPFKKRGKWCVRDVTGLHKFNTESEALEFMGIKPQLTLFEELEALEEKKPSWFMKNEDIG